MCVIGCIPETFVPGMYIINGDIVTLEDGRKFGATQHHQLWVLHDVINHPYYRERTEAERECMRNTADEAAFRDEQDYEAEKRDEEQAAKKKALEQRLYDLEWRIAQLEERMRFA